MTHADVAVRTRHLLVEGRVQGVGFRWFVRERARRHALHGWVCNRDDGSVELQVAGPVRALEQFCADVVVGPPGAHVKSMHEIDTAPAHADDDSDHAHDIAELPFPFVIRR